MSFLVLLLKPSFINSKTGVHLRIFTFRPRYPWARKVRKNKTRRTTNAKVMGQAEVACGGPRYSQMWTLGPRGRLQGLLRMNSTPPLNNPSGGSQAHSHLMDKETDKAIRELVQSHMWWGNLKKRAHGCWMNTGTKELMTETTNALVRARGKELVL